MLLEFMNIIRRDMIACGVHCGSKQECLQSMTRMLEVGGIVSSAEEFLIAVNEREKALSTGIGYRIAIPHAYSKTALQLKTAVYLLDNEIDFDALDGQSVRLVLMTAIPEKDMRSYPELLKRLSGLLQQETTRKQLLEATGADEMFEILKRLNED
ncbi:MAG: PTS sugar transporter subunit IIA [Candidatus Cloacimonetes bacterium]|nr:PTS sugar transporter subunit IIA [Candidatus Cloacimonadota bacterium]